MPITSGSHEMFGELLFDRDASKILEQWLEEPDYMNEYERRDRRWWLEATFVPDGQRLQIYERERTNYQTVEKRVEQADRLARAAEAGWIVVQHFENGVTIHSWQLGEDDVEKDVEHGDDGLAVPEGMQDVVDHYHREMARQDEAFESRSAEERFDEVAERYAPLMRCLLPYGGDDQRRAAALDRLAETMPEPHVAWDERESLQEDGTVVVPELDALSEAEQEQLGELIEETEYSVLAAAREYQTVHELPGTLYFAFSEGTIDLSEVHPSVEET